MQCGPFVCVACGACEIGPEWDDAKLTDREKKAGWYEPGRQHMTSAPTIMGEVVDHKTAKVLYELGLLDEKQQGQETST